MSREETAAILERLDTEQQEIGGDPLDELHLDLDRDEIDDDEILRAAGLRSDVRDREGELLGHILMTEWDDVEDPMIPLSIMSNSPGISILLRSSPQNYHHYNLSVRGFAEQIRDAAAGSGDLGHVRWAARRGYFVLRISEKIREESGETYKSRPELVAVSESESKFSQSREHLETLLSLPAVEEIDRDPHAALEQALESGNHGWVGEQLRVDQYQSVSDRIKEQRRKS